MPDEGLSQAYVCECQQCQKTITVYTPYQDRARARLVNAGWGTSRGKWYCPSHVGAKQAEARAGGRKAGPKE
jgi:hypothetical protein